VKGTAEANCDVCAECLDEITCGIYTSRELEEFFPEMCLECFIRVADETTQMCAPCYARVVWGGTLSYDSGSLKTHYPSRAGSNFETYTWWEEEEDLPIPAVADELESIPAMRVAA
jgi:hypothetical protein